MHAVLALPSRMGKHFPVAEPVMVEGAINGFPFRTTTEPEQKDGLRIGISAAIGKAAGAGIGDGVRVEITRIGEEPEIRLPTELDKALKASPAARATWTDTTPLARRDWILWITTARKPETRLIRIEKACDMLAGGKRRVCCFPGLNWMTRDHVAPEETWTPLPSSRSGKTRP